MRYDLVHCTRVVKSNIARKILQKGQLLLFMRGPGLVSEHGSEQGPEAFVQGIFMIKLHNDDQDFLVVSYIS